ncbi:hypothetical protein IEQ34_009599 [Dendrobium chrysotoxum]|uniref:Uncharacterized protein n=1 Tax=Dendrobium chrysotoxum TaxID=161865 RepID=A0AAV7H1T8_DENCH|nr:hypothetical protein IEQ34_009599 [Dendrobium chrysotoxum]
MPLKQPPMFIFPPHVRLQHIKQRREVEHRLLKPPQEERRIVCSVDDPKHEHIRLQLSNGVQNLIPRVIR